MKNFSIYPFGILFAIFILMVAQGVPITFSFVFCIFIGLLYYFGDKYIRSNTTKISAKKYAFIENETIFNNSILVLIAAAVAADKKNHDNEFRYIEKALRIHFPPPRVESQINYIKKLIAEDNLEHKTICKSINMNFQFNEKIQLLHLLVGIVCADGLLTKEEKSLVSDIALGIQVPSSSLNGIFNMFNFINEEQAERRHEQSQNRKKSSSSYQLRRAFKILGVAETASEKQIKKAYRKLAMKHHPDRLIHLGPEHQKSAKEKFQAISDAYEMIKEKKGFS